jgi:hypothetical protein
MPQPYRPHRKVLCDVFGLRGPSTYGNYFRVVWYTPTFHRKMLPPSSGQSSVPTCYCLCRSVKCCTKHPFLERLSLFRTWGWIFSRFGLLFSVVGQAVSDVTKDWRAFSCISSSPLFWTASPWKKGATILRTSGTTFQWRNITSQRTWIDCRLSRKWKFQYFNSELWRRVTW